MSWNFHGGMDLRDMGCHSIEYTRWVLGKPKVKSVTAFEEIWNYGFPQEMHHFVNCMLGKETPLETGEDGREVLKIMYAAYQSAGEGRKVEWPYHPPQIKKPIDLWKAG